MGREYKWNSVHGIYIFVSRIVLSLCTGYVIGISSRVMLVDKLLKVKDLLKSKIVQVVLGVAFFSVVAPQRALSSKIFSFPQFPPPPKKNNHKCVKTKFDNFQHKNGKTSKFLHALCIFTFLAP